MTGKLVLGFVHPPPPFIGPPPLLSLVFPLPLRAPREEVSCHQWKGREPPLQSPWELPAGAFVPEDAAAAAYDEAALLASRLRHHQIGGGGAGEKPLMLHLSDLHGLGGGAGGGGGDDAGFLPLPLFTDRASDNMDAAFKSPNALLTAMGSNSSSSAPIFGDIQDAVSDSNSNWRSASRHSPPLPSANSGFDISGGPRSVTRTSESYMSTPPCTEVINFVNWVDDEWPPEFQETLDWFTKKAMDYRRRSKEAEKSLEQARAMHEEALEELNDDHARRVGRLKAISYLICRINEIRAKEQSEDQNKAWAVVYYLIGLLASFVLGLLVSFLMGIIIKK